MPSKDSFFLSFEVKIQFFKTFILPYFDYGLSLIIYFSKKAITKLAQTYYSCLYKLFKFKFNNNLIETNHFLKTFNIFSFEHRIVYKILKFSFLIKNETLAPRELKQQFETIKPTHNYSLRVSTLSLISKPKIQSNYGAWSLNSFFADFYNKIKINRELFFINNISIFNKLIHEKLNEILIDFLYYFSKFEININFSYIYY